MDVLEHDGDTFGIVGSQVIILQGTNHVCFNGFQEGEDGGSLETHVQIEFLCNLTNKIL